MARLFSLLFNKIIIFVYAYGFGLAEGVEFENVKFKLALKFNSIPNAQFSTTATLLANPCCAIVAFRKLKNNGLDDLKKSTKINMSEQTKQVTNPRHVVKAWEKMPLNENRNKFFIEIENGEDVKGVAPVVKFTIQSDPIGEVGVNGCQALDMLEYTKCLFQSLNDAFPCRENALTITKIEEAIHWQEARTKDRLNRQVEGQNKA